ncbi:MAG: carboxymuconolactone decarboxylase family protein [Myxococcaceae bacterium]
MQAIDALREQLPDAARDIKLNLQSVLTNGTPSLTPAQRWGVAIACAYAARNDKLRDAILQDAEATPELREDAKAAAILMGMNNVYYRFRHMIGKETYSDKPARLRMLRLAQVATNKADFELLCLAVSAINGCETCVQAHEKVVLEGGLSDEQVHDAIRIAATLHAAAVALEV